MLSSSFESKNNTNCLLNVFSAFIPFFLFFLFLLHNQTKYCLVAKEKLLYFSGSDIHCMPLSLIRIYLKY